MPARPRQAVVITLLVVLGLSPVALLVTAPSTSADEAVDTFTQLPLSNVGQVLVDDVQGQTFVSGGRFGEGIAVAPHDGLSAQLLPDTAGATEMAPSTDQRTVYAAMHEVSEIVAVDTASLSTSRIDTGDLCVSDLAATSGALWLAGESCPYARGWQGLYRLDLSSGSLSRIGGWETWNDPLLATIPGSDHFLLAQTGTTGDRVVEWNDLGEKVASTDIPFIDDLEVFRNGEIGVLSGSGTTEIQWLSLGDLATTSSGAPSSSDWISGGIAMGETEFAGWEGRRVTYLDKTTGDPTKSLAFGPKADHAVAQVELRGTTLYAVTYGGRLYRAEDATAGVRTLTISGPHLVERGDPIHLSGSLFDGTDPIAGQVVTIRGQEDAVVGEATTDDRGEWTFDLTATGEGSVIWVAFVPASGYQRAVSADLRSGIADPTPLLEVTAPDKIQPDQPITVSGRVTHDGEPLAGRPISLYETCDFNVGSGKWVGDATTASDGTFEFVRDPGDCDFYSYRIAAWSDANWRYTEARREVVLDWRRPTMAVTAVPSGPVGSPMEITATLTDQGEPVVGKPVRVWVRFTLLGTFTTDANGEVHVTYTTKGAGSTDVSAQFDGDSVSRLAFKRIYVEIDRLPSTLNLSAPETISEGDEVVLTGTVESDGAPSLEGLPVLIERTVYLYGSGYRTELGEATTDASGAFTLIDTQPRGGQAVYTASFTHPNFEPATAEATVIGAMDDPVLTVKTDRRSYTAGDIAHIRVNLETDAPRPVVVMSRSNRSTTELWSGDLQGVKDLELEPRYTSHISVQVGETDWSTYQIAKTTLPVRLLITTQAKGGYDTVNGFRLYRPAADPVFASTIDPPRSELCLRHQVQKRVSGEWTTVRTSACVRTDSTGHAQWRLLGDQARRTAYRVRAVFEGGALNAATNGPWVRFKFE